MRREMSVTQRGDNDKEGPQNALDGELKPSIQTCNIKFRPEVFCYRTILSRCLLWIKKKMKHRYSPEGISDSCFTCQEIEIQRKNALGGKYNFGRRGGDRCLFASFKILQNQN